MFIREFSIDRFGMLAGQRVSELSPGVTVFFGENEAGKSTCLNFFRAMLFGYARNRRSIDYLTDSKALSGGSLLLESDSLGPVRLARVPGPHGGKVTLSGPDGTARPESDLAVLLRGCTPELFDKVFAFSLGELMQFSSLTDDNIRHALHGAAFGTGLASPGQVLRQLDDAMRQIYAPRASSSKIHGLLRDLDEINAVIKERGNEVDRYALLREKTETAARELEASRAARLAMEEERRVLERTIALRRRWDALRDAEDALAAHPERPGTFTPDGRERLDRLAERLEDRQHVLAQARYALERAEAERSALAFDPALAAATDAMQSLAERKERARSSVTEIQVLRAERESLMREAAAIRADLGPDWGVERLQSADLSLAVHEECETLGRELSGAEQARAAAQLEAGRLERETLAAREALEDVLSDLRGVGSGFAGELGGDTPDAVNSAPDEAALERLSQLLTRAEDAHGKTGPLALAARNADHALDAAVAAVEPSWTRQDCERAALAPAERERLLGLARAVTEAEAQVTERERDKSAAALIHDDIAERVAMLERTLAERAARLFRTMPGSASGVFACAPDGAAKAAPGGVSYDDATAALATSALDSSRRVLCRAQAARKTLETAQTAYDTANEQLGDIVSLVRGKRSKSAFPWATVILFSAVLFLVCGGGLLYLGLQSAQENMTLAGTGSLAGGLALGLAWLALAARGGADAANELMERNWDAIEQRLIRARLAAQDARLGAAAVLEALPVEAPDLFPSGSADADGIAEAEQILARRRDLLTVMDRDAKELERETAARGAAEKRLTHAASMLDAAARRHAEALDAWRGALASRHLPPNVPAGEARSFFERLDAAASCRANLQARLADQQASESVLAECLRFARSIPELADMLASLPEPGSHFAPDPGPWLALARDFMARQRTAGRERIRLRELAAMRRARHDELSALLSRAEDALRAASAKEQEAAGAWRSWLRARHLSESLSPETARRALESASKARAAQESALRIGARIDSVRDEAAAFIRDLAPLADLVPDHPERGRIRALAENCEEPDGAVMAAALSLLDDLAHAARNAGEKAAIAKAGEKKLPALRDAVTLAEEQAAATRAEMEEMLRLALCDTPESYRSAHAAWEQREAALAARRTMTAALEREAADASLTLESLAAAYAAAGPEDAVQRLAEKEEELAGALAREHALAGKKGGLEAAMEGLLNEKGLTELLARRESVTGAMRAAAREWSRYAVAREMLLAAKGRFESERQGGVVRYAGEIFSAVTGGAYKGITVSLADESVAAVAADGGLRNPEGELSRGTREQLYLALRLAYVLDHGVQAEKLPVVMDDILVNFDDRRAERTASVLGDFAGRRHQVLFFTCHKKTVDMLMRGGVGNGVAGYALEKGNFVRM